MKRITAFVLILFVLIPLFGETYYSNALGQIISTQSDFTLETEANRSVLFKNGVPVRITELTMENGKTVRTVKDLENDTVTVYLYDGFYLSSVTVNRPDNSEEKTAFIYSDGNLVCTEHTDSEGNRQVEYYLRNDHDLSLFAVRRYDNTDLVGENYIYTDRNLFTQSSNLVATGELSFDQEGNITFTRNGTIYTYGPDSCLLREESDLSVIEYTYSDLVLVSSRETSKTEPQTVTLTEYEDGKAFTRTTEVNGVITQYIQFKTADNEGMVKTLYSFGKPVARVYYRQDNIRVIRVEYL